MIKKFLNFKNELETKLIKNEGDLDKDLDTALQRRKRIIALLQ